MNSTSVDNRAASRNAVIGHAPGAHGDLANAVAGAFDAEALGTSND